MSVPGSSSNVLSMYKPDSNVIEDFVKQVRKLEESGKVVRTTLIIVAYDDDVRCQAHTTDRLCSVLGLLDLSKDIIKEHYLDPREE